MTNALSNLANVIMDCMIAAVALWMLYRGVRVLRTILGDRWLFASSAPDPVATDMWDVLAEARSITEQAVRSSDATE